MPEDTRATPASDLIREIVIKQRSRGEDFITTTGLSPQAARTIGWIDANPGAIQREIADMSGTTPASVASLLKGLEAGGYLERRPDPDNSRVKRLYALPKAHAISVGFDAMAEQRYVLLPLADLLPAAAVLVTLELAPHRPAP